MRHGRGPRGAAGYVPGIPRMGFPALYLVDGSVGVGNATGESTALPSAMASAATWDLDLAYQYGVVLGKDMRAHGVNVHLGGNVNLVGREPRNGRAFETKGEDPILAGRINAAHLKGTQDQNVVACIKHFAAERPGDRARDGQRGHRRAVRPRDGPAGLRDRDQGRRRAVGDGRLQPGGRRLVLGERLAAQRRAEAGLGLPGLRHVRLVRDPQLWPRRHGRAGHGDARLQRSSAA